MCGVIGCFTVRPYQMLFGTPLLKFPISLSWSQGSLYPSKSLSMMLIQGKFLYYVFGNGLIWILVMNWSKEKTEEGNDHPVFENVIIFK